MFDKPSHAKRALRRKNSERMKRKARRVYPHDPAARAADHLKTCSCAMCGNGRRYFGEVTMQEKRADAATRGALLDLQA